jgi:tetratricopeptide (TPR) repeat protein
MASLQERWQCRGWAAVVAAGAAVLLSAGPAAQSPAVTVPALLDAYAAGRFDEALAPVRSATKERTSALRQELIIGGAPWVDASPPESRRRALAAAAFTLEAETIAAEQGRWRDLDSPLNCGGRCALEWACTVLRTHGEADEAEHIWYAATVALAGGVRDWTFLVPPIQMTTSRRPRDPGHVAHALGRVPGDARIRLAGAVAVGARFQVGVEMEAPRQGRRTEPAPEDNTIELVLPLVATSMGVSVESAMQQLMDLAGDPVVGAEARLRLGYLLWRRGGYTEALRESRAAAAAAQEDDVRYLANFVASQAAQTLGDLAQAESLLEAALAARPHSQSAALALAALQMLRGDGDAAYTLVEGTRANRPTDDDPWRMFLYGDFTRLPGLLQRLRAAVRS